MSEPLPYPALVAALAAAIPAGVVVDPAALAYFRGSIDEAKALEVGADFESVTILDEVLRIGADAMAPVLAGKVGGYGPMRMRYGLDLAAELASRVEQLDTSRVGAAGASTAKSTSLKATRALRTRAVRVLKSLAGGRPEEKARLAQARQGAERPDERARALQALAKEIQDVMSKVPLSVATDAGATQELVEDLMAAANAVLGARGDAQGARSTVAKLYDEMNVLDGRLHHELRHLVGAMRDARKEDKTVPAVKSPLFKSGKSGKKNPPAGAADAGGTGVVGNG